VALVRTDVSEERMAIILEMEKVKRIGKMLAVTGN
jgi:hypothetical protein